MAYASVTAENQALDSLALGTTNVVAFVNLCSATPGTTGTNESASTTRQAGTWNAASGGSKTNSSAMTFTTPGTVANTFFATFSASTAGIYGIGGPLSSSVTATTITVAAGALTLSAS